MSRNSAVTEKRVDDGTSNHMTPNTSAHVGMSANTQSQSLCGGESGWAGRARRGNRSRKITKQAVLETIAANATRRSHIGLSLPARRMITAPAAPSTTPSRGSPKGRMDCQRLNAY